MANVVKRGVRVAFTKMQAIGNDYIYFNLLKNEETRTVILQLLSNELWPQFVEYLSIRRFGIGADGVIIIAPPDVSNDSALARMIMYNSDGTKGTICGNGLRCVAQSVYDTLLYSEMDDINSNLRREFIVQTDAGEKNVAVKGPTVDGIGEVTVGMGLAKVSPLQRVSLRTDIFEDGKMTKALIDGGICSERLKKYRTMYSGMKLPQHFEELEVVAVDVGNKHIVIFWGYQREEWKSEWGGEGNEEEMRGTFEAFELEKYGPLLQFGEENEEEVNVEFVWRVKDKKEVWVRVYEKGSEETMACGSGACAVVAAAVKMGMFAANDKVKVKYRGGCLEIESDENLQISMTGEAVYVYEGSVVIPQRFV